MDVTATAGLAAFHNTQGSPRKDYIVESIGGGCAFIDFNRDGNLDILLVRGTTLERLATGGDPVVALYENRGNGTFLDVTERAGLAAARGWGMGITVADYDNDGWPDFLVTGLGRNFLFHNEGNGKFTERARESGLIREGIWSTGAAFGDLDLDGNLDVYIAAYVKVDLNHLPARGSGVNCTYKAADVFCGPRGMPPAPHALFRNQGNGKFVEVTRESGISEAAPPFFGLQPVIADFDGDGRPDIFVANDSTPNYLFHNEGQMRFREIGLTAGVAVNMDGREQASMGVDVGDFDNDGGLDIFVTTFSEDTKTLYHNRRDGTFEDESWRSRIGPASWLFLGWGTKFFDYDNDGLLDLIATNGHVYPEADRFSGGSTYRQRQLLYHNQGNGMFTEVGAHDRAMAAPGSGRGLAVGDYDNDGRVDVLINNQDGAPLLLKNNTRPAGHWLDIELRGKKSNRDGVGALVKVTTPDGTQTATRLAGDSYLSGSSPRLHFGLGERSLANKMVIRWPSGHEQQLTEVMADRRLLVEEP